MLIDAFDGELCTINSYAVLASDSDVKVLTCSSSIGPEAEAFGKQVDIFSPVVQNWAYAGVESVRHGRDPRLWEAILNSADTSLGFRAKTPEGRATRWRSNELREELGAFGWTFGLGRSGVRAFYDLGEQERIGLTERAIRERRTLLERWDALKKPESEGVE